MPQIPSVYFARGDSIDYTPTADIDAGQVVVLGSLVGITRLPMEANVKGALAVDGIFKIPQDATAKAAGSIVYWNPTGNPVGGMTGSGAVTSTAGSLVAIGKVVSATTATDQIAIVRLSQ
jgi:predicted RecA/RadA family phage recombinase